MKHFSSLIFSASVALLAASCGSNAPQGQFTLNGEVEGLDGQEIYLYLGAQRIDTAVVENGRFAFTDTIGHEQMVAIIAGELSYENQNRMANFFIEPGEMTLTLPADNFTEYKLTGSASNDLFQGINEQIMQLRSEDEGKSNEAMAQFMLDNPDSYVTAYFAHFVCGSLPYERLKEIYDGLSPRIKQSEEVQDMAKELEALERILPGKPAPNIAKTDINGQPFDMSSFKGNVILLDFWASWCKPCRASNPHVKALYDKYHDKGLEVVMVSDDDTRPEAALKAIEEDGTGMFHHVLRGLKQNPKGSPEPFDRSEDVSEQYAIHYLPTKYLIDRDFNIVGKMSDEELDKKLEELFGF